MFRIAMLPATNGDCLWIEYGKGGKTNRVLIDGGVAGTSASLIDRIESVDHGKREFELLVISHIDNDHIEGVLRLLQAPPEGLSFGDIWFNGWKHLPSDPGVLGVPEAEAVTALIEAEHLPWNEAFDGGRVAIDADATDLPVVYLPGGMKLTVMGPSPERLGELVPKWEEVLRQLGETVSEDVVEDDGGVLGGDDIDVEADAEKKFKSDDSESNGSSIVLLAEYEGKKCLFTGDSFSPDVLAATRRTGEGPLELDAMKVSHHGSRGNVDNDFLDNIACANYLVSTNGYKHRHPSREAISRILVHGRAAGKPTLHFNYSSTYSEVWNDSKLKKSSAYGYRAVYPDSDGYLEIDL